MIQSKIALLPLRQRAPQFEPKYPEQLGLWPLKAKRIYPSGEHRGTQYAGEVIADNGVRFVVKTRSHGAPLIPFAELFSYELCRALSVATPSFDRIEMPDGEIAFGSRYESASEDGQTLADRIANEAAVHYSVGIQLSRLIAVDSFLPNRDRSFKNLRWLPQEDQTSRPALQSDGPMGALIALDFSRAFLALEWPLPSPGFVVGTPSRTFYSLMRKRGLFESREVGRALDQLANLPNGFIEMVISKSSASWLEPSIRDSVFAWWTSPVRGSRVEETERHLKHELKISIFHN